MQQNEYLLAKIGVDTAENEPLQIWGVIQFNIHFTPYLPREVDAIRVDAVADEAGHRDAAVLDLGVAQPADGVLVACVINCNYGNSDT